MGRWAEVYFTSAPEKREEAVLELLRELEARKSESIPPESEAAPCPQPMPVGTVDAGQGEPVRCQTCGHDNPSKHQFCGMCGSQLGKGKTSDGDGAEKELGEDPDLEQAEPDFGQPIDIDEETVASPEEPRDPPYDLSLFRSLRAEEPGEDLDYDDSPSFRYRYYIGALLAILILVLGYLAWRGGQASQRAQGTPPPPPIAAAQSAVPASSTAPASALATRPHAVEAESGPRGTKRAEPTMPKPAEIPKPVKATASAERTLPSSAPPTPRAASNHGQAGSAGNGAEEYAAAERYLNSEPRDSAEAAKWLWKAMAKHNGPAALALAELYLKGDGVSKNCDQARVLLDSAARRDMAGAGKRLRNLQAFGCQ
jgi:hypothetical protein